jgi:hypothetical protein
MRTRVNSLATIAPEQFDEFFVDALSIAESSPPMHGPLSHRAYLDRVWKRSKNYVAWARGRYFKSLIDDDTRLAEIVEMFDELQATSHRIDVTNIVDKLRRYTTRNDRERYSMMLNGGSRRIPTRQVEFSNDLTTN